jgi:flagellar biosynthesis protein FlhB
MAEHDAAQERTEEATPRRREKALAEGQVPRSQEFSGAIVLLSGVAALALGGGAIIAKALVQVLHHSLIWMPGDVFSERSAARVLRLVTGDTLRGMAPVILGVTTLALGSNLLQARGVISAHPIKPKLSNISPLSGLRRIMGWQSVFTLFKSIVKLGALGLLAYLVFRGAWIEMLSMSDHASPQVLLIMKTLAIKLAVVTGVAFLALSLFDYLFQVRQHERQLRMTRQEVVQEHRESEGDPLIKSRIRSVALAMARKRMLREVATADVVVTNPTHLAVALKYDSKVAPAPIVVAMGARKLAERIRAIATSHQVPIVENKPLAQALMATASVGRPIPPALYVAVAEVLAFIYKRRDRAGHAAAGHGAMSVTS